MGTRIFSRKAKNILSRLRMTKPVESDFIEPRFLKTTLKLVRWTCDLDDKSYFNLAVCLWRMRSRGALSIMVAETTRGFHVCAFKSKESGCNDGLLLRSYCNDDPLRVELDRKRPPYARQVLFSKKVVHTARSWEIGLKSNRQVAHG